MNNVVQLLYGAENLLVPDYRGITNLSMPNDIFQNQADPNFIPGIGDRTMLLVQRYLAQVFEVREKASIQKMFCPRGKKYDFHDVVLTQAQIMSFSTHQNSYITQKGVTSFFLTEEKGRLIIVKVAQHRENDKPSCEYVDFRFAYEQSVCEPMYSRIIVPKLK